MSFVDEAVSLDSDEEPIIGLAEWVKNKKPMSCPFGHKEPEKFAFDITKADRIFDFSTSGRANQVVAQSCDSIG